MAACGPESLEEPGEEALNVTLVTDEEDFSNQPVSTPHQARALVVIPANAVDPRRGNVVRDVIASVGDEDDHSPESVGLFVTDEEALAGFPAND